MEGTGDPTEAEVEHHNKNKEDHQGQWERERNQVPKTKGKTPGILKTKSARRRRDEQWKYQN